jgi:hypothetical protein
MRAYATRLPIGVHTLLQKKSVATMQSRWAARNVRHVVSTPLGAWRSGSGSNPSSTSTRRTELRLGVSGSLRSSPTIRRTTEAILRCRGGKMPGRRAGGRIRTDSHQAAVWDLRYSVLCTFRRHIRWTCRPFRNRLTKVSGMDLDDDDVLDAGEITLVIEGTFR